MNQKIYVGNLSYDTTAAGLKETFSEYGDISEFVLITDRETGRSKGFGFITFEDAKSAESALEMDGKTLDNREIKVSFAQEKKQRTGGGDSRGGRW